MWIKYREKSAQIIGNHLSTFDEYNNHTIIGLSNIWCFKDKIIRDKVFIVLLRLINQMKNDKLDIEKLIQEKEV